MENGYEIWVWLALMHYVVVALTLILQVAVEGGGAALEPSLIPKQFPHYNQQSAKPKTAAEVGIACILLKT